MSIRFNRILIVPFLMIGIGMGVSSQESSAVPENPEGLPIESDWSGIKPSLYARGDQTFVITLGTTVPTLFYGESGTFTSQIGVGGTGSLNYNYFVSPTISIGGEISGIFAGTVGRNVLYLVPFGFKAGYQFIFGRFEVPLSLSFGGISLGYLNKGYLGIYAKPAAAVYWRFNPDWSFGLNTAWMWVPQWMDSSKETVYGNFLEITLAARYHF